MAATETLPAERTEGAQPPTCMDFLMVPDYTIVTLVNAIAVLRMANRQSGRELYRWRCLTLDGEPVPSSDGLRLLPDDKLAAAGPASDILFVCGGYHPERHCTNALRRALHDFDQRGAGIGALCTGARIVAEAGLLDDHRCAIHWENAASLREQFPEVQVSSSLFVIDRNRYTCSGGVASIDLMLQLVSSAHGGELAREIAEQFVLERVRTEKDAQRTPLHYLIGAGNQPKLVDVVAMMEANVEEPLTLAELAEQAGITRRQLERLFHRHLHCTPSRYYLDLRLHRGRLMLLQTSLAVREIAERCGFSSTTSFAKRYVEKYGKRPASERAEGN